MENINKLIVETVGTFILLSVILHSLNDKRIGPIGISSTILAIIYLGSSTSGAHYNPVVTVTMILNNKISANLGIFYILAQLFGGIFAFLFNKIVLTSKN
jgi:glycerol uptake facilitator-like aquaporin